METSDWTMRIREVLRLAKDVVIVVFVGVLTWRVAIASFGFQFETFDFSDLLALILALFAMALSAAFYFRASKTSTDFYDRTFKFTKDMSEMLGRIEAGFGERLRHIDEGYTGLAERFDRLPLDPEETKRKIEEKEAEVEKVTKARDSEIEDVANRAKLAEKEKRALMQRLRSREGELEEAKAELNALQELQMPDPAITDQLQDARAIGILKKLMQRLPREMQRDHVSLRRLRRYLTHSLTRLAFEDLECLRTNGLMSSGEITDRGTSTALELCRQDS